MFKSFTFVVLESLRVGGFQELLAERAQQRRCLDLSSGRAR